MYTVLLLAIVDLCPLKLLSLKVMEALKILKGDVPIKEACRYTYCLRNPTRKGLLLQPTPLENPSPSCFVCNTNTVNNKGAHGWKMWKHSPSNFGFESV